MQRFTATLYTIGLLRCVDVPLRVSRRLAAHGSVPVRGRAAGVPFESTLIARGEGAHRLYVHSRIWRPRTLAPGDRITIELEHDPEPRETPPARDFLRALEDRPAARSEYFASGPGLKREIANWLAAAKQPATRQRRIERALDTLEGRHAKRRAPCRRARDESAPDGVQ